MKNKWHDKIKVDSLKAKFQQQLSYPMMQPYPMPYYQQPSRKGRHDYKYPKYPANDYSSSITGNISDTPRSFKQSYSSQPFRDEKSRDERSRDKYQNRPEYKHYRNKDFDPKHQIEGIMIYLHYLKNFPTNIAKHIYIRSKILIGAKTIKDNKNREMVWNTSLINIADYITQDERGHQMMREMKAEKEIGQPFTVLPIMESYNWMKDFYTLIWDNDNRDRIYIMLEVCERSNSQPIATAKYQLSRNDGTIRIGRDELSLYKFNAKKHRDRKEKLNSQLVIIIHHPEKEQNATEKQFTIIDEPQSVINKKDSLDLSEKSKRLKDSPRESTGDYKSQDYEEQKGEIPEANKYNQDNQAYESSVEGNDGRAYIENKDRDVSMKDYTPNTLMVFYIDGARFLHENATITRVTFRAIDDFGGTIMKPEGAI